MPLSTLPRFPRIAALTAALLAPAGFAAGCGPAGAARPDHGVMEPVQAPPQKDRELGVDEKVKDGGGAAGVEDAGGGEDKGGGASDEVPPVDAQGQDEPVVTEDGGAATEAPPEPSPRDAVAPIQATTQESPAALGGVLEREEAGGGWAEGRAERRLEAAVGRVERLSAALRSGAGQACSETCEVAEAICASRDVICELGQQYREHRDTCSWAEAECESARGLCRGCGGER